MSVNIKQKYFTQQNLNTTDISKCYYKSMAIQLKYYYCKKQYNLYFRIDLRIDYGWELLMVGN